MDDYLAMFAPPDKGDSYSSLLAPLAGFLFPIFSRQVHVAVAVLVEGQKVPEGIVQPVVTQDLTERIATLQQQVLSQSRLQPMLERSGLAKPGQNMDEVIDNIRLSMSVEPVVTDLAAMAPRRSPARAPRSRLLCELHRIERARGPADLQRADVALLEENLKIARRRGSRTTDFSASKSEDTKHNLDDLDNKLAAFKKQYMGAASRDEDNNLRS